jgi:pyridoxine/pyridoxamine 5'-phosphate oxidase
MVRKNGFKMLFLFSFIFFFSGCGYNFSGEGDGPKPGLKFVAIPVFENKTSEPDLGALFAGALRREFMQKGHMKIVPVDEAEAVFKGTVKNINVISVAHNTSDVVANRVSVEYRVYVTLDVRCEETKTRKVLWSAPAFQYYKVYRAMGGDPLHPDAIGGYENRRTALEFLADEMATRIHDRFLSNF